MSHHFWPSVVTWWCSAVGPVQTRVSGTACPANSSSGVISSLQTRSHRESISKRLRGQKRMSSQQTQVSTTGNKGGSPGACPGQQSNTALQELQTLEQICVSAVLSNLRLLQDHCMDGVPDYLRFQLFESIRAKNPLLLHGKILRAIVSGAHFEELDLKHACNLRDCDLEDIASSLVKVRKLEAAGCHYITEGAVATTLRQCTSLTSLKLESNSKVTGALCLCPDVGTFSLSALTSLSMAESEGFCDAGLTSVVKRSTQLVDLNVCKCQALGEAALASLAIPTLTRLSVAFLPNLSDAALQRIARCCTNITSLDLAGSYNVGDRALKSVAARLGGIQVLCLSFLDKISDESVEHIAVGCAQLESLSTEQTAITDASLDSLILYSVNLKDLNLAFCHNLSESKIMSCLQQRRLRLLNVSHCRGVSLQTRFWLMAKAGNSGGGGGVADVAAGESHGAGAGGLVVEEKREAGVGWGSESAASEKGLCHEHS